MMFEMPIERWLVMGAVFGCILFINLNNMTMYEDVKTSTIQCSIDQPCNISLPECEDIPSMESGTLCCSSSKDRICMKMLATDSEMSYYIYVVIPNRSILIISAFPFVLYFITRQIHHPVRNTQEKV